MEDFNHEESLIFDVGMNHGADAAFYAEKGFDVLSIEANPASIDIARERYKSYFDSGKMNVLNVALAEQDGTLTFYVCNEESGKSTTSRELVGQLEHVGFSFKTIEVPCTHIGNILSDWGVPYYMKIDIEGYDIDLVRQLKDLGVKPSYISVEVDIYKFDGLMKLLKEMGYTEFQLVSQGSVPAQREPEAGGEGISISPRFSLGNSGLFGKDLPDAWVSGEAVRRQVAAIRNQHLALRGLMKINRNLPVDLGLVALSKKALPKARDWYDLHAR